MNTMEYVRGITSVTVSRTSSLREQSRIESKEDQIHNDTEVLMNKRSLSNDKISFDSIVPTFIYQRGGSLRQDAKTSLSSSSPNSNNHHSFKTIKPIDTSPRSSESRLDHEIPPAVKVSTQRLKFKHRQQNSSQGGPLIPDHNLIKDPPRENIFFTPRPPLAKKFSSEQDETNSDIDTNQSIKNARTHQMLSQSSAPRPPISPTRGLVHSTKGNSSVISRSTDKNGKVTDNAEEDTSGMEDNANSDCESPPQPNESIETIKDIKHRSSLRKGSNSPIQSDGPGRGSPSPTKTVKWNLNAEVKKIPRSRSMNGKFKSSRSRSHRSGNDVNVHVTDQQLVESHEAYISHCTNLMRRHMSLLEDLRHDRISTSHYKKDLSDFLYFQAKLVTNLRDRLAEIILDEEKVATETL